MFYLQLHFNSKQYPKLSSIKCSMSIFINQNHLFLLIFQKMVGFLQNFIQFVVLLIFDIKNVNPEKIQASPNLKKKLLELYNSQATKFLIKANTVPHHDALWTARRISFYHTVVILAFTLPSPISCSSIGR